MIVSINQPAYLPWPGYFDRIAASDCHVVLDHVQFEKNSFVNRNKVRTKEDWCWLTVPVSQKGLFGQMPIDGLSIVEDGRWRKKHWDTLRFNYAGAPFFEDHRPFFEDVYSRVWEGFLPLVNAVNEHILGALGIAKKTVFSSRMEVRGRKQDLILDLCRRMGADVYLSGPLGRNYIDESVFREAGIRVVYQDYTPPVYPQVFSGFVPGLSVVDLLFNCGPRSMAVVAAGRRPPEAAR